MRPISILLWSLLLANVASSQTVTVTASPSSLTFNYQIGAATLPTAQSVSVRASSGTPTFTTSVAGANSQWLIASPDSGKLPGSISARPNPTSLPVGQYTATIDVTVAGVANPLAINVTLNVTSPPATLTVTPSSLAFTAPPSPVPSQTLQVSTTGAPISFTVTAGAAWLSVTPTVGVALPGEQETLTITADPTSLAPQANPYTSKITIVQGTGSSAKTQAITVSMTVNAATPTITSIWPNTLPVNPGSAQTITVHGTNFYTATTAAIQGVATPVTATVLSPSTLLAVIPNAALTAPATLNLVISNPAPGGPSSPAALTVANVPSIVAVTNVGSYGSASISPGELVTIFGTNIGPATPASMTITNGLVDTTLSGVTVTIDGQNAPMLYVSQNQVTAQVPYEVTQGAGKQVVLTNGVNAPANSTVTITATAPGLFTSDGSGANQAAALNYNSTTGAYSLNTSSNPAHLGDTIVLYLTGEGDYNPTLSPRTGLIVPASMSPLPQVNPLPTVTIGGAPATVTYAGPLIGSILGLLQINCVVPATATTGQAVPLVVTIGGVNTQSNVTLSIHQ